MPAYSYLFSSVNKELKMEALTVSNSSTSLTSSSMLSKNFSSESHFGCQPSRYGLTAMRSPLNQLYSLAIRTWYTGLKRVFAYPPKLKLRHETHLDVPIALMNFLGKPSFSAAMSSLGQVFTSGDSTSPRAWREEARRSMTAHHGARWEKVK